MLRPYFLLAPFVLLVLLGSANTLHAENTSELTTQLPRYQFSKGQVIEYSGHRRFDFVYDGGTKDGQKGYFEDGLEWTVWILRTNPDGSWRCVFRRIDKNLKEKELEPQVYTSYFDIHSDGRIEPNDSLKYYANPAEIFPLLPATEKQMQQGWQSLKDKQGNFCEYKREKESKPNIWCCSATQRQMYDDIYGFSGSTQVEFDRANHRLASSTDKGRQESGFKGDSVQTIQFKSISQVSGAEIAKMSDDVDMFFTTQSDVKNMVKGMHMYKLDTCKKTIMEVQEKLTKAKSAIRSELFSERIDALIKEQKDNEKFLRKTAEAYSKLLDKPAAEWELEDLDGKKHKLSDYKGKVVVYDFWYKGCGWCIKAMPQIKQVVEHYKGKPVAILGMNRDSELQDAKDVVEQMKLNYLTLRGGDQGDIYVHAGWPTLIFIDRKGIVRHVHVAYSDKTTELMKAEIDKLLAE